MDLKEKDGFADLYHFVNVGDPRSSRTFDLIVKISSTAASTTARSSAALSKCPKPANMSPFRF